MKYIIAFLNFWKKFIIGDDLRVAATIMWTFLLINAMANVALPVWYIVPIVVIGLIVWLLWDTLPDRARPQVSTQAIYQLVIPLYITVLLPASWFRVVNNDITLQHFFVPAALQVIVCSVVLLILMPFFRRHAAVVTMGLGVVTWWLLGPGLFFIGDMTFAITKIPVAALGILMVAILCMSIVIVSVQYLERTKG